MELKEIVIGLDSKPLTHDLHLVGDYSSYEIIRHCSLALTKIKNDRAYLFSAKEVHISEPHREFLFLLNEQYRWSNGDVVKGLDYARAFQYILDSSSMWKNLLSDVIQIKANTREVYFKLKKTNKLFLHYLSAYAFSPKHEFHDLNAGQYYVKTISKESREIVLTNNLYFPVQNGECLPSLRYKVFDDPHDIFQYKAYMAGYLDVTCNTINPLGSYFNYRKEGDFVITGTEILMALTSSNLFPDLSDEVGDVLKSIDGTEIAEYLEGNNCEEMVGHSVNKKRTHGKESTLPNIVYIAYEDFYPNYDVIIKVKNICSEYGIEIVPREEYWGQKRVDSHYRLTLIHNPIGKEVLYYENYSGLVNRCASEEASLLYERNIDLLKVDLSATNRQKATQIMDTILQETGVCIPLLSIRYGCLMRNSIERKSFFNPGEVRIN